MTTAQKIVLVILGGIIVILVAGMVSFMALNYFSPQIQTKFDEIQATVQVAPTIQPVSVNFANLSTTKEKLAACVTNLNNFTELNQQISGSGNAYAMRSDPTWRSQMEKVINDLNDCSNWLTNYDGFYNDNTQVLSYLHDTGTNMHLALEYYRRGIDTGSATDISTATIYFKDMFTDMQKVTDLLK